MSSSAFSVRNASYVSYAWSSISSERWYALCGEAKKTATTYQ